MDLHLERRALEVFGRLLETEPSDWPMVLDRECHADATLRRRVEELLASHRAGKGMLSTAEPTPAGGADDAPTAPVRHGEGAGTRIGAYKLLELIGEGGFGSVFLAEQESPVRRRVALKIIKLGMDTRQVIARFEAERQALAIMDHPNIAKVFDAGATESGRPYFVMELVRGIPITEYCDKNSLDVPERLTLFQQVCQAVQHAHQKGVIHRDIKPSNVLVTSMDSQAVPKVIDFGIAKATSARLTEKTLFTELRALIGTPEYMSPEQADLTASDIDTRSDVYSLGVLLYELLTGALPFDSKRLRSAAYAEIQRIIREEEPPKPSTRLSALEALPSVAACRRMEPGRLERMIRGDLDWIAMKCLEKDRTRRYETASALAADVARHMSGEPVVAAPPSTGYRVLKFVKRNKGKVVAGAVIALVLVLGASGTTAGMVWALSERDRVQRQSTKAADTMRQAAAQLVGTFDRLKATHSNTVTRELPIGDPSEYEGMEVDALASGTMKLTSSLGVALEQEAEQRIRAERSLNRTEAIKDFIVKSLQSSDPLIGGKQEMTIVEAMENAVRELDSDALRRDPEIRASLQITIAEILTNTGHAKAAKPLCEEALETVRRLHQEDHDDVAASMRHLASALVALGEDAASEALEVEAFEMIKRLHPGDHPQVAASMDALGRAHLYRGNPGAAKPLILEALAMRQRLYKGDHGTVASSLSSVGFLLSETGQELEAETYQEQSLTMLQRLHPGDHPTIARALSNFAASQRVLGKLDAAERFARQALEMGEHVYRGDHGFIAMSLVSLAMTLIDQGRAMDAEPYLERAIAMQRRIGGDLHPDFAVDLNNLGLIRRAQGRFEDAENLFLEALAIFQHSYKEDHAGVAAAMDNVGAMKKARGDYAGAERYQVESYEMTQRLFPGDHLFKAQRMNNLARLWHDQGELGKAERLFKEALAMYQRLHKGDHTNVALGLRNLAWCHLDLDNMEAADQEASDAVAMFKRMFEKTGHPVYAVAMSTLAMVRHKQGQDAEAKELIAKAEVMVLKFEPPAGPNATRVMEAKRKVLGE